MKLNFTLYTSSGSQVFKLNREILNAQGKVMVDIDVTTVSNLAQGMYFYRIELHSIDGLHTSVNGKWLK